MGLVFVKTVVYSRPHLALAKNRDLEFFQRSQDNGTFLTSLFGLLSIFHLVLFIFTVFFIFLCGAA